MIGMLRAEDAMKKLLMIGVAAGMFAGFVYVGDSIAGPGTCTSNKNRCVGHCRATQGSRMNWCIADCESRWGECMNNGTWRYTELGRSGVITGVQKR
jgi:hypothetical protein